MCLLVDREFGNSVLNGMRHPSYVDDSLGALRSPPFDVDVHLYETFIHM